MIPEETGIIPSSPAEKQNLLDADYLPCRNLRCDLMVSPEAYNSAWDEYGQDAGFTCPRCSMSYGFTDPAPFGNGKTEQLSFSPGGQTIAGLSMDEQGKIGEEVVHSLKELPGYGAIVWAPETYHSALDGRTQDWGIEVKTLCVDAAHHKFVAGRKVDKVAKNQMAHKMGLRGILGLLVTLDYRRSLADIYAQEQPLDLEKLNDPERQHLAGIKSFRTSTGQHLVAEVPFENPLMSPDSPQPERYGVGNSEIPF